MKPTHPAQVLNAVYRYCRIPFAKQPAKPVAYLFFIHGWKTWLADWLPGHSIIRRDKGVSKYEFYTSIAPRLLTDKNAKVYVWSYREDGFIKEFCFKHNIPYFRIEDGFLRSVALGAEKAPPLSLCFDSPVLYFDASAPSRLEQIIQTHDFAADPGLMERARTGIRRLLETRLSKYNVGEAIDIETIYGPKDRKRVLVVGQVEGDQSIIKGGSKVTINNDLVRIAARENPDAQIIYKPHPEVLRGLRKDPPQSNPRDVEDIALVMTQDVTLADSFRTVDHVYTISSLSGFEALIRGIPVTCFGMPFYAGWGATTDKLACPRRTARRTAEEIFAAAYILYPTYFDPILRKEVEFEDALDLLFWMKRNAEKQKAEHKDAEEATEALPAPVPTPLQNLLQADSTASEKKLIQIRAMRAVLDILDPPKKPATPPAAKPKKISPPAKKKSPLSRPGARG